MHLNSLSQTIKITPTVFWTQLMELHLSLLPAVFAILSVLASTHAAKPTEYWHLTLPNTPLPNYLHRQIQLGATSTSPFVYRPDVNVGYAFNYAYLKGKKTGNVDLSNVTVFFLHKDLKPNANMWPLFHKAIPDPGFLSRSEAESIPFSSDKIPEIMNHFSVKPKSTEDAMIRGTIEECESPTIKGEEKNCATSLESLIDFNTAKLGNNVRVIPTDVLRDYKQQKYTVVATPKLIGEDPVISHKLSYPFALFYSHYIKDTKVYLLPLVGADGSKIKALGFCHMDTSNWHEKHISFQVLNAKPGIPICHFPGSDALIWMRNK